MTDILKVVGGPKDIIRDIERLAAEFPQETYTAMGQEVEAIGRDCDIEVPVKTGNLRGSRRVYISVQPGRAKAIIGYICKYALPVHENLQVYHSPPTKAKFLEDPARRRMSFGYFWISLNERVLALIRGG